MATQYIMGELTEWGECACFYAGHVTEWKPWGEDRVPAWCGEAERAYVYDTQEDAQRHADMFSDYSAVKGYGTRYAVYAREA